MNTSKLINVEVIKVSANKLISNFAIALVTAIGLTSDSTCLGGKIFGTGVILEIFHWSSTMP